MEYKKLYTKEELDELVKWFKDNWDKLPDSLYINKATYIPDFKHTLTLYYDILDEHQKNSTYSWQIHHVFLMREAVIRTWGGEVKPEK